MSQSCRFCFFSLLLCLCLPATADREVDRLMRQLGDTDWTRRENASATLMAHAQLRPLPVVRALLGARHTEDLEVRARSRRLLERLEARSWWKAAKKHRQRKAVGQALRFALAAGRIDQALANNSTYRLWLHRCYRDALQRGATGIVRGEDELFLVQDFALLRRDFPKGRYVGYQEYVAIAGGLYFGRKTLLRISDPARELRDWQGWIARHPQHPGQDDAWYRLGRAREMTGDIPGALIALEKVSTLVDGDMAQHAEGRRNFIFDVVATSAQLEQLIARKDASKRLRKTAALCLGVTQLREGRYADAVRTMAPLKGVHAGVFWSKRVGLARRMAALDGKQDAASRYQRARLLYHCGSLLDCPAWGRKGNAHRPSSYWADNTRSIYLFHYRGRGALSLLPMRQQRAYLERATARGAALRLFLQLVSALPKAPNRDMALYSAATASAWLADFDQLRESKLEQTYREQAIALYDRVARIKGSPLAWRARLTSKRLGAD